MLITISGPSGSGKSTVAERIGKRLRLPVLDTGKVFRAMAKRGGMDLAEFSRYAAYHPEIDRGLDREIIRRAGRRRVIVGRLAGWMVKRRRLPSFRIWLTASQKVRARRIAGREDGDAKSELRRLAARDSADRRRYLRAYGLDVNDRSVYHAVIRTDDLTLKEVVDSVLKELAVWQMKSRKRPAKRRPKPARKR